MAVSGASAPDGGAGVNNLALRVLSALVMIPVMLGATWAGSPWFELLIGAGCVLMIVEWAGMTGIRARPMWFGLGIAYAALYFVGMAGLRQTGPEFGMWLIFWLFATVWGTDTAAYFAGRAFGGPKLAPRISPNKTWSGFVAGLFGGALAGAVLAAIAGYPALPAALTGIAVALLGQGGDLLESALKRRFGTKDSSQLIPGHGGILDRVDSLVVTAPALLALQYATGFGWPLAGGAAP